MAFAFEAPIAMVVATGTEEIPQLSRSDWVSSQTLRLVALALRQASTWPFR